MNGSFRIEFAHWTGGDGYGVALRIEDDMSGERLMDVSLSPDQFTQMMRGGVLTGIEGRLSPHLDRVGKRMENDSYPVPGDAVASYDRTAAAAQVHAWAAAQDWASEWETFEPRSTNAGWIVIVRRWVADLAAEVTA